LRLVVYQQASCRLQEYTHRDFICLTEMAANNHACSSKPRAHSSLHHSPTHHSVLKHMLIASQIHDKLPEGLTLISAEGFKEWFIDLQVLDPNPLYINKTFRLKFTFSDKYPMGISSLPRNPSPYSNTLTTAPPRTTRSSLYSLTGQANPYTSPYILQWHHLSRPLRPKWLVACPKCAEH